MFYVKMTEVAQESYNKLKEAAEKALHSRKAGGKTKSSKQEGRFKQINKTIDMLRSNPKHPGLRTHEYTCILNPYDNKQKVFEAYAQNETPGAYRVFFCYGPTESEITIIAITPHP